jgi:hypothetical protein
MGSFLQDLIGYTPGGSGGGGGRQDGPTSDQVSSRGSSYNDQANVDSINKSRGDVDSSWDLSKLFSTIGTGASALGLLDKSTAPSGYPPMTRTDAPEVVVNGTSHKHNTLPRALNLRPQCLRKVLRP